MRSPVIATPIARESRVRLVPSDAIGGEGGVPGPRLVRAVNPRSGVAVAVAVAAAVGVATGVADGVPVVSTDAIVTVSATLINDPGKISSGGSKKKLFSADGLPTLTLCPEAVSVTFEKTAASLSSTRIALTLSVVPVVFRIWNSPAFKSSPSVP